VVQLGLEHFDKLLLITDLNHSARFDTDPTGIEIRLSEPANRLSFARQLERQLGPRFRAIPLEELIAPLLKPKHAASR